MAIKSKALAKAGKLDSFISLLFPTMYEDVIRRSVPLNVFFTSFTRFKNPSEFAPELRLFRSNIHKSAIKFSVWFNILNSRAYPFDEYSHRISALLKSYFVVKFATFCAKFCRLTSFFAMFIDCCLRLPMDLVVIEIYQKIKIKSYAGHSRTETPNIPVDSCQYLSKTTRIVQSLSSKFSISIKILFESYNDLV